MYLIEIQNQQAMAFVLSLEESLRQGIDSTDNPNLERWFLTFAGL